MSVIVAGVTLVIVRVTWTDPTIEFCRNQCGLNDEAIEWLVKAFRGSGMTREAAMEMFRQTSLDDGPGADSSLCEPCAHAILDAAGISRKP